MSFLVNLGFNGEENIKVGKSFTGALSVIGVLRAGSSVVEPEIEVEGYSSYATFNYAYIPEFGRYYYIVDIREEYNGLVIFKMRCDVLTTYANDIRNQTAVIERNANDFNLFLSDSAIKSYQNAHIFTREFPAGFPDGIFVMAIAGGG